MWDVVRGNASKKVHYKARLAEAVRGVQGPHDKVPFTEAYPDAVLDEGWDALTPEAFEASKREAKCVTDADYVKHILHKHDGEVRHWGPRWWTPVPAAVVANITHVRFWHYQLTKTREVRTWLYWYHEHQYDGHLSSDEINWILQEERGETTLLKRGPASGGTPATWYIREGNHVTLAELFNHGCHVCSCHFLYTLYLQQTVFITKRHRSESTAPGARVRRHAKNLHHQETGRYGLPTHPW